MTGGYTLPPDNQKEGSLPLGHTGPHGFTRGTESLAARPPPPIIKKKDLGPLVTAAPSIYSQPNSLTQVSSHFNQQRAAGLHCGLGGG